jgi:hypothetical protein
MQGGVSVKGGIRKEGRSWRGAFDGRGHVFLLWERAERGCEIGVLRLRQFCGCDILITGTGLLEVLGSEGQDIRRYPGARSFS